MHKAIVPLYITTFRTLPGCGRQADLMSVLNLMAAFSFRRAMSLSLLDGE